MLSPLQRSASSGVGGSNYAYQFGLFDKDGHWTPEKIKDAEVKTKLETTLRDFHRRLGELLTTMELTLEPAENFKEKLIKLSA